MYAYAKAVNKGYIDAGYRAVAEKALHIDTDFVRKFLLFHSSVFSYGLYVLS